MATPKAFTLVVALLIGACGHRKVGDADDARCTAFADRVTECAFDPSIKPQLSDDEKKSVRSNAYSACTKTTDDEATLHYYGDVDKKIACMQGKSCVGVRVCLTETEAAQGVGVRGHSGDVIIARQRLRGSDEPDEVPPERGLAAGHEIVRGVLAGAFGEQHLGTCVIGEDSVRMSGWSWPSVIFAGFPSSPGVKKPLKVSVAQLHCGLASGCSQFTVPPQATGWFATSTCTMDHSISQPGATQSCCGMMAASAGGIGVCFVGAVHCFCALTSPRRAATGCGGSMWHSLGG